MMRIQFILLLLLSFSFVFADDALPWEEEVYKQETGFILTFRSGWTLERELGVLEDDVQAGGDDIEIEGNYDAGGLLLDFGLRYQHWYDNWLWSLNGMISFNPYYKNDADIEVRNITNGLSAKAKDDAEAFHLSTEFSAMIGLGTPDSFHFEMGPGFYYRYTDVEFEDANIDLFKTHFFGFTFDFVFRAPLDKQNKLWLKLFARVFPYSIVDSETEIDGAGVFDIDADGTENWKSFKLEASVSYTFYQAGSSFLQLELGWNYNRLQLTGINDDNVINGDNAVDNLTFVEHGPFVALNLGL